MSRWMRDRHKMPLDGEEHAKICREFVAEIDRQRRAAKNTLPCGLIGNSCAGCGKFLECDLS